MNTLSTRLTPVRAEGRGLRGKDDRSLYLCTSGVRDALGDKIKYTGYYKIPFIVTPRHLYSEGNEKSVTVTEDVALYYPLCLICLANKY